MAKKEQELTASMIDTFREFKETKNIDRTTLVSVLEDAVSPVFRESVLRLLLKHSMSVSTRLVHV